MHAEGRHCRLLFISGQDLLHRVAFSLLEPPFTPMDRTSAELAQQLSLLLGRTVQHTIRKTNETPPRVSIIDVLVVITGQDANVSAKSLARLAKRHPEVTPNWCDLAFSGRGQKKTPVTGVKGIVVSGASKTHILVKIALLVCFIFRL